MKKNILLRRIGIALSLGLAISLVATGCGDKKDTNKKTVVDDKKDSKKASEQNKESKKKIELVKAHFEAGSGDNITFVDSLGRKNEVKKVIKRVIPSGTLAQLMISMVAPEKFVSLSTDKKLNDLIPKNLPKTGQLYGGKSELNAEEILKLQPDIIIDLGEAKGSIKEDLQGITEKVNAPAVFISASMKDMSDAFEVLGKLLGEEERGKKLAAYVKSAYTTVNNIAKEIDANKKLKVYQTSTPNGLGADLKGTIHAELLDIIGATNAADIRPVGGKPGQTVSMEQIFEWQPDVIIARDKEAYNKILKDSLWKDIKAVKEGKVFLEPTDPYGFLAGPPSANRVPGLYWLGSKVYPNSYKDVDVKGKIKQWYELAYHRNLTDADYEKIIENK